MLVKKVLIDRADRLYQMPPDILDFARPMLGRRLIAGQPVIDLASFEWPSFDEGSEKFLSAALSQAPRDKVIQLREALADWLSQQFDGTRISPKEIFLGNGVRSLVWHCAMAFVEQGDTVLVPGLGIPYYRKAVTAAGGLPVAYPLSSRNGWIPELSKISPRASQSVRACFVNTPHNPTGTELDDKTLGELIARCGKENTLLINDACYFGLPSRRPLAISASESGRRVGLELFSFSYLLGLPAVPFGFAVGHRNLISALESAAAVNPPYLSGAFVEMALSALRQPPSKSMSRYRQHFAASSGAAQELMGKLGLQAISSPAVPFLWAKLPLRRNSVAFARMMLKRYRILMVPGTGFGESGQGFVRLSLTAPKDRYAEAVERIKVRHLLPRRRGDK